jgi:hypothetical protein
MLILGGKRQANAQAASAANKRVRCTHGKPILIEDCDVRQRPSDSNSPRDRTESDALSYKSGEVDVVIECAGKGPCLMGKSPPKGPSARILRLRKATQLASGAKAKH